MNDEQINMMLGKAAFLIAVKENFRFFHFVFLAAFILFSPPVPEVHSAQITLAWDASTDPNIAGYRVHYGNASGNYSTAVDVGKQTSCTIANLSGGMAYYFAATEYDTSGQESGYSNEAVYAPSSSCAFSLSPTATSFNSAGGPGTVGVTAQTGCAWTANSNVSWLVITSNSSGTGNRTINYSVTANLTVGSRSGTMTVAGVPFTVNQTGLSCSYSIAPASQSFSAGGGAGSVTVAAASGCSWSSSSSVGWVSILSGSSGSGNGTVGYSVSTNPNGTSRTGTVIVAGKTLTVSQSAISRYSLTVAKAGNGNGTVTANPPGSTFTAATVVPLIAIPDANSAFAGWSGGCSGTSPTCKITMNSNTSSTATFNLQRSTITARAGANGSISPPGAVAVRLGASQVFTITPNRGYRIADVKVDGVSVGGTSSYLFGNVMSNHTIDASFSPISRTYGR